MGMLWMIYIKVARRNNMQISLGDLLAPNYENVHKCII